MRGIVFDYGGTLAGMASLKKSLKAVLEHELAGVVGESIERRIGALYQPQQEEQPAWQDIWRAAFEEFGLPYTEELARAHLQEFLASSVVYDFVPALLHELRFCRMKVGLLSNATGPSELFVEDLRSKGLAELFDATAWSCETGLRKPARSAFEVIAERLGEHPSSLLMVGDNEVADIEGAMALDMRTVRVYSSGALPETAADLIVRNRDLPTLMRGPRHALLNQLSGY